MYKAALKNLKQAGNALLVAIWKSMANSRRHSMAIIILTITAGVSHAGLTFNLAVATPVRGLMLLNNSYCSP
jgi:hypothetical protein